MSALLNISLVAVTFLVMLSLLVAAHELGHYLFARLFGMGCEEFAIGFGKKPLLTYARRRYFIPLKPTDDPNLGLVGTSDAAETFASSLEGGSRPREVEVVDTPEGRRLYETTEFTIRPIPLGGFVRIKGMIPEEDGSEVKIPGGFYSFAPWKRLIVLFAGPAFSLLAGILLLIPLYMSMGLPQASTVIAAVQKDSAAEHAGMKAGDKILSVNGVPTKSHFDLIENVWNKAGQTLQVVVRRQGKDLSFAVQPKQSDIEQDVLDRDGLPTGETRKPALLGVMPEQARVRLAFTDAVRVACYQPVKMVTGLVGVAAKPKEAGKNLSGPVGIVATTKDAVESGPASVVMLAALLSISLGIFNLLPVFPLDGGQMVVAFAEMLRGGKRISLALQGALGTVGLAFVFLLVVTVTVMDVGRFANKSKDQKPAKVAPAPAPSK